MREDKLSDLSMQLSVDVLKSDYISNEKYKELNKTCSTIRSLLIASIKTAKENAK